jgi:hypothetical protein
MQKARLQMAAAMVAMGILTVPAAASAAAGPWGPATAVAGVNSLDGVTCPTAKTCVSVGLDEDSNGKSAVINASSGAVKVWSGDLHADPMNAIACPGTKSCLAVADDAVASAQVSNGAMKVTATPKKPANGIVALGAIACAGATNCYAVGFEGTEAASNAIVVRLSSAGKLLGTAKNTGTGIGAITCPSSSLCLMGEHFTSGESIQLLNNGKFGASHAMPASTYVQAMSCYKASLCYALGGNSTSSPAATNELFPLNPKTGAIGSMATIPGFDGTDISCINASTCLISGFTGSGATAKVAVVAVVNAKLRTPVNYPGSSLSFHDLACASTSACYAVGSSSSGAIVDKVTS